MSSVVYFLSERVTNFHTFSQTFAFIIARRIGFYSKIRNKRFCQSIKYTETNNFTGKTIFAN